MSLSFRLISEQLLHSFPALFPGIDRVVTLSLSKEGAVSGQELIRKDAVYRLRTLIVNSAGHYLETEKKKESYLWLHPNELPFDRKENAPSYHLFSESQYVVLSIKLENIKAGFDFYYLFFREDQSNLGISRLQGGLDTARKSLIGALVLRMLRVFYQSAGNYEEYIRKFRTVTQSLFKKNSEQTSATPSPEWMSAWIDDFLKTFSLQPIHRWVVPSETVDKLALAVNYDSAKTALTQAAEFAAMLYATDEEWPILPSFITFPSVEPIKTAETEKKPSSSVNSRMVKAHKWLDNIEEATSKIVATGEDPTGSAVGQSLSRPVSAPAITDWLRQNQRRVLMLLNKYPAKWPNIREHFRPLTNLVERDLKMRQTS